MNKKEEETCEFEMGFKNSLLLFFLVLEMKT